MAGYSRRDTADGWIDDPELIPAYVAKAWLDQHSLSMDELKEDLGEHQYYRSDAVFHWLGY